MSFDPFVGKPTRNGRVRLKSNTLDEPDVQFNLLTDRRDPNVLRTEYDAWRPCIGDLYDAGRDTDYFPASYSEKVAKSA